uniref:Putative dienelactone hydrolase n=1 Tax=Streptomyces fradiae TaxID=1906 RepID=D2SNG3_STRFR|nr:putative dienelactone hydrolase [Streptomyces fradiae]
MVLRVASSTVRRITGRPPRSRCAVLRRPVSSHRHPDGDVLTQGQDLFDPRPGIGRVVALHGLDLPVPVEREPGGRGGPEAVGAPLREVASVLPLGLQEGVDGVPEGDAGGDGGALQVAGLELPEGVLDGVVRRSEGADDDEGPERGVDQALAGPVDPVLAEDRAAGLQVGQKQFFGAGEGLVGDAAVLARLPRDLGEDLPDLGLQPVGDLPAPVLAVEDLAGHVRRVEGYGAAGPVGGHGALDGRDDVDVEVAAGVVPAAGGGPDDERGQDAGGDEVPLLEGGEPVDGRAVRLRVRSPVRHEHLRNTS